MTASPELQSSTAVCHLANRAVFRGWPMCSTTAWPMISVQSSEHGVRSLQSRAQSTPFHFDAVAALTHAAFCNAVWPVASRYSHADGVCGISVWDVGAGSAWERVRRGDGCGFVRERCLKNRQWLRHCSVPEREQGSMRTHPSLSLHALLSLASATASTTRLLLLAWR